MVPCFLTPRAPQFSIIVPVFDRADLLALCLRSIRESSFTDYELIVSDDGSQDAAAIARVATEFGAQLVRAERSQGSAAARNRAARAACGERLAFVDADVTLHADTLERLSAAFATAPSPDAVIGSYDRRPSAPGAVSRFRNLLHAHVHHRSRREARTFWTGCGAVSRARFEQLGGFDESYRKPSIEDVEFGMRLHQAGGRILLDASIQVTHHKRWTLASMIETDLFHRAVPWTALLREQRLPRDLNFRLRDRLAAALSIALPALLAAGLRHGAEWWTAAALDAAAVAALQFSTLAFLRAAGGWLFAAACFPLLLLYNMVCMVGLAAGLLRVEWRNDRWFVAAAAACLALVLALQAAAGAYRAEWTSDPDEPAHFVTSLMVYDYVTGPPREHPLLWAENYYLHYPKVALGHWPPGYYAVQAAWWLALPPSRASALWLNALLVAAAAYLVYRMIRMFAPRPLALAAALLLAACPATQQSYGATMADSLCLLLGAMFADACLRVVERPAAERLARAGAWLVFALLTKGTAAALVPAPLLAIAATGKWRAYPKLWGVAGAVTVAGSIWYGVETFVFGRSPLWWGGVTMSMPWPIDLLPGLAGWGVCVLAVAGIAVAVKRRSSVSLVAAAVLVSACGVSAALRAMNQPRHWMVVLPALFILAAEFLSWCWRSKLAFVLATAAALWLFPWSLFRQSKVGVTEAARLIARPARVLAAGGARGEGAMVAAIALSERRPASVVVRSSQLLAHSGWNGENYRLTARSPQEVARLLDEAGVDTVTYCGPPNPRTPHLRLLAATLEANLAWREEPSMEAPELRCWRRALPPAAPRQPLRIDLRDRIGRVIQEPAISR